VQRWTGNPYWQWVRGCAYVQHELPCDPGSLARWRKWICPGRAGERRGAALQFGADQRRHHRAAQGNHSSHRREALSQGCTRPRAAGHEGRSQAAAGSHRLAKRAAVQAQRYARASQMRRMRREPKRLKTSLGRVYCGVARNIAGDEGLASRFAGLLGLTERRLTQERTSRNEVYSLHTPEVVCIVKGKANRPYEFGSKGAVAGTNREGFVLASKALKAIRMAATRSARRWIRSWP